ncbi:MAG: RAMP superfamily CRISPR-associated protein [Nitrososphaerales archaeon]
MPLHEKLENRALMEFFLKTLTPLHVGAGGVGEITKTILQFTVGNSLKPIIPAESIKGVLRAEATRIAKRMSFSDEVNAIVNVHNKAEHSFQKEARGTMLQKASDFIKKLGVFENIQQKELGESSDAILEIYASYHCPICRLFGSKYLAGKLLFTDAIPVVIKSNQKSDGEELETEYLKLGSYTSTAINRKTGTVEERRLFTTQYVEPSNNLRFYFKIIGDNILRGDEAKLLANVLEYMSLKIEDKTVGINLGGAKSRGFGEVEVDEDNTVIKLVSFTTNHSGDEKLKNIRKLLFKEGFFEAYKLSDFIKLLKKEA